jgi:hypothetical protein
MSTAIAFAKGGAAKAPKPGPKGGVLADVADAIAGSGGCGNGTQNGKRGFQPGNKCHQGRNAAVSAAQKKHTALNAVTRKHLKAGTLNTPAGRAAIKTAAAAARELKAARDTHKAEQKARYATAAKERRAAAKATAAKPESQAAATLKAAQAEHQVGGVKPADAPKPTAKAKPAPAPKPTPAEDVASASKAAMGVKADKAATHLSDLHARVKAGAIKPEDAHKHLDKIARGHTKDELFAAAKSAGIEHGATTKKALVEHLKATAHPDAAKIPLKDFADRVVRAAHATPTGGFGDEKTMISHVKAHLEKTDPAFRGMSDAAFKARLVEANHARHLELGRADLVEAMHPGDLKASATPHLGATYHFVRHPEAPGKAQSRPRAETSHPQKKKGATS